jgi:hypothetical protein
LLPVSILPIDGQIAGKIRSGEKGGGAKQSHQGTESFSW